MQIELKNVSHVFDKKTPFEIKGLDNVSATIKNGDFIGIIGESGSSKTTFIQHLNALLLPTEGEIIIADKIIKNTKRKIKGIKEIRQKVGIVFQFAEYQLFEETILKDIIFGPINMGIPKTKAKEIAKKYIKVVGMDESFLSRSPFSLSGGQKRRIAIAGILSMEPDFLIFDEPTAGLDPEGTIEMMTLFKKLNKLGKTIVVVTHNLDNVLDVTSKTMLFKNGKLIKYDETYKILEDINFLKENNMEPPHLLKFVHKLRAKGMKIGKVTTLLELVNAIKKIKGLGK